MGGITTAGKTGWRVIDFFLPFGSKWQLNLMLYIFLFVIFISTVQALQQKTWYPYLDNTAGKMVSADNNIYSKVDNLQNHPEKIFTYPNPETWSQRVKFYFQLFILWCDILSSIYFIYFVGWAFYQLFKLQNNSLVFRNIVLAILVILLLNCAYSFTKVFIIEKQTDILIKDALFQMFPVKGVYSLGKYIYGNGVTPNYSTFEKVSEFIGIPNSTPMNSTSLNVSNVTG
jgi:hypothetical protein